MLECSFVGSPETVRRGLHEFSRQTAVDELIVAAAIHDHNARLTSYEILSQINLD
jgi:alkanesulfonate monooxygenase SsuD/methylene tetrahydromethanopterin reductase-like flavin-dependent oxidoreductase (luciferase family)